MLATDPSYILSITVESKGRLRILGLIDTGERPCIHLAVESFGNSAATNPVLEQFALRHTASLTFPEGKDRWLQTAQLSLVALDHETPELDSFLVLQELYREILGALG